MNTYYLVMDYWNSVVARFENMDDAARCARASHGYVVACKCRPF